MSQSSSSQTLHRALLRPMVIATLRAYGFAGTKPSVLDTLLNITERYILLLASSTAQHALNSHNDAVPTLTDVRMAMQDCGVLIPLEGGAEEEWEETMRRAVGEYEGMDGGEQRARLVGLAREDKDLRSLRPFVRWFDGKEYAEIKRVAGMAQDSAANVAAAGAVGVGGTVLKEEDFLEKLKKRYSRAGASEDARLAGTVLGKQAEGRGVVVEGGPVMHLRDWRPRNGTADRPREGEAGIQADDDVSMTTEGTLEG